MTLHTTIRLMTIVFFATVSIDMLYYLFSLDNFTVMTPKTRSKRGAVFDHQHYSLRSDNETRNSTSTVTCNYSACSTENSTENTTAIVTETVIISMEYYTNVTKEPGICPLVPPDLGPVGSSRAMVNLAAMQNAYIDLKAGGIYKPRECRARQSVAIIVPYRGHIKILSPFLYFMHPFLMKQQLDYQIFIVEYGNKSVPFHRGELINIGVAEAQKQRNNWSCLVLHDPQLLPLDLRNLYRCSWYPRLLVSAVNKMAMPPVDGVIAITPELYTKINGFSNIQTDRDADYNEFYRRLTSANYTVEKTDQIIGSYRNIKPIARNRKFNITNLPISSPLHHLDGLSTVSYIVNYIDLLYFYTHIHVTVDDNLEEEETNNLLMFQKLPFGRRRKRMAKHKVRE